MDIVERLRDPFKVTPKDAAEAADEIERLRGERWHTLKMLEADLLEADAEIGRLREALRHIAKRGPDGELWNTKPEIWMIARAALKETE